jgi:excinuclease ABC subunit A
VKPLSQSPTPPASTQKVVSITGARVNNLKNVDVTIPRNALTVITGLSGSGKSSLAFDTLYAEGQRRFVESLSAYARQFLDRMNKPDVDAIHGLPPAVAIEQQTFAKNPRSTVGTTTEIYDFLRLLYGRIGIVIDKETGEVIRKDNPQSVTTHLQSTLAGARIYILAELPQEHAELDIVREGLRAKGFSRLVLGSSTEILELDDVSEFPATGMAVYVLVDRIVIKDDDETQTRLMDSIEQAFEAGSGRCVVRDVKTGADHFF